MKVGITGYAGRLGSFLLNAYPSKFVPLECDVTSPFSELTKYIRSIQPDLVLHLASKSGVDFCEDRKNESLVIRTNVNGTFNVACATEELGIGMVLLSSASVFSGNRWFGKYKESTYADPVNFYGYTKQAAESFVSMFDHMNVIRTSYLFDKSRLQHILDKKDEYQDFPTFMKRSFMYMPHFALSLVNYLGEFQRMPFILNVAGNESCSWYDFVKTLFYQAGYDTNKVIPRRQEEEGHAPRGRNLGLDVSLSAKLDLPQFSYYDGIKAMLS